MKHTNGILLLETLIAISIFMLSMPALRDISIGLYHFVAQENRLHLKENERLAIDLFIRDTLPNCETILSVSEDNLLWRNDENDTERLYYQEGRLRHNKRRSGQIRGKTTILNKEFMISELQITRDNSLIQLTYTAEDTTHEINITLPNI